LFSSRYFKNLSARAISKILNRLVWDKKSFQIFEQSGVHVTPNLFYYSIPNTRTLGDDLWEKESELVGIDMNISQQLTLLKEVFPKFGGEWVFAESKNTVASTHDYYSHNATFGGGGDAEVLHSMIRHFKPKKVVEIGSGFSTYLSARACLMNKEKDGVQTELFAIEPFPNNTLKKGFPGLTALIERPLETVDLDLFTSMEANDILFIDSTHVLKIGGDVKYEYLEILPRLQNGVIVHCHDIFFPGEYPKSWVLDNHWFWTEQYLLQAFLAFNNAFEILWAGQYMNRKYTKELKHVFSSYLDNSIDNLKINPSLGAGSLWIRRKTNN
jgi:predicted O-methyltransferase YrrM